MKFSTQFLAAFMTILPINQAMAWGLETYSDSATVREMPLSLVASGTIIDLKVPTQKKLESDAEDSSMYKDGQDWSFIIQNTSNGGFRYRYYKPEFMTANDFKGKVLKEFLPNTESPTCSVNLKRNFKESIKTDRNETRIHVQLKSINIIRNGWSRGDKDMIVIDLIPDKKSVKAGVSSIRCEVYDRESKLDVESIIFDILSDGPWGLIKFHPVEFEQFSN